MFVVENSPSLLPRSSSVLKDGHIKYWIMEGHIEKNKFIVTKPRTLYRIRFDAKNIQEVAGPVRLIDFYERCHLGGYQSYHTPGEN